MAAVSESTLLRIDGVQARLRAQGTGSGHIPVSPNLQEPVPLPS